MAYSNFDFETIKNNFALIEQRDDLFGQVEPLAMSDWLKETLALTLPLAVRSSSEKARSEFIIAPILLEMQRRWPGRLAIYSGEALNVDKKKGLVGECDFLLAKGTIAQVVTAPLVSVVEAKRQDLDWGLGQCVAQMIGAQLFNQKRGNAIEVIFGCVTTGETWQFMALQNTLLRIHSSRYYIDNVPLLLGVWQGVLDRVGV